MTSTGSLGTLAVKLNDSPACAILSPHVEFASIFAWDNLLLSVCSGMQTRRIASRYSRRLVTEPLFWLVHHSALKREALVRYGSPD
jgi:hypothetical protein